MFFSPSLYHFTFDLKIALLYMSFISDYFFYLLFLYSLFSLYIIRSSIDFYRVLKPLLLTDILYVQNAVFIKELL